MGEIWGDIIVENKGEELSMMDEGDLWSKESIMFGSERNVKAKDFSFELVSPR